MYGSATTFHDGLSAAAGDHSGRRRDRLVFGRRVSPAARGAIWASLAALILAAIALYAQDDGLKQKLWSASSPEAMIAGHWSLIYSVTPFAGQYWRSAWC